MPALRDISPDTLAERHLTVALLRLRRLSPFFATVSAFAHYRWSDDLPTAATDGRDIFLNPGWFNSLLPAERVALLLHEVLHAALQHLPRRSQRQPEAWNIAADIVVNAIIDELPGIALPAGALRDAELGQLSVELVYERIRFHRIELPFCLLAGQADLLAGGGTSADGTWLTQAGAYWQAALHRAFLAEDMAKSRQRGHLPAGLRRAWELLQQPQVDWRSALWRYLTRTPCDFQGFDRRFVHQGLYLDALEAEALRLHICIDTSGSVGKTEQENFAGELAGILSAYPHIEAELYFADAALHGPHPVSAASALPPPVGGGGTSFRPFFARMNELFHAAENTLCLYMTDGDGEFPERPPLLPTLWLVTPGGVADEHFPFGDVIRLAQ